MKDTEAKRETSKASNGGSGLSRWAGAGAQQSDGSGRAVQDYPDWWNDFGSELWRVHQDMSVKEIPDEPKIRDGLDGLTTDES